MARLVGAFVAPLLSYVVLSFPEGRLHSRLERWVVAGSTALVAVCWVPLVFITAQPVIASPLIRCAPHCPHNVFFVGASPGLARALEAGVRFGYALMLVGVVFLLLRRLVTATTSMRRMLMPALVAAIVWAGGLAFYLAAQPHGANTITVSGWIVVVAIPMISVALLLGLVRERAFVRSALVRLVTALPGLKDADQVRTAMAAAFKDDSVQIFFWRAAVGCYVDRDGKAVGLPKGPTRAVTELERDGEPVAAMVYDSALGEDERFIRAIAEAAMLGVDKTKLESDLQRSQLQLVQAASLTRERLARDLHDGAQQHLVAALLRLDLAADAVDAGAEDAAGMVRRITTDLEDALDALRRLSNGMSPARLAQWGLEEALAASALRSTIPVTVTATRIGRYTPEVEAAVYFSCVEALQNAAKHAGPEASIKLTLSDDHRRLRFEVADTGVGFDARDNGSGNGLTHIHDRIGSVGGQVAISSTPNHGTSVSATIPIHEAVPESP